MPLSRPAQTGAAIAGAVLLLALVSFVAVRVFAGSDPEDPTAAGSDPSSSAVTEEDGGVVEDPGPTLPPGVDWETAYQENLDLLLSASVRNTNHDNSPFLDVASADLVLEEHLGPRTDYLDNPGGNPEQSFPTDLGGQFRAGCEFSHFGYDDPLVAPYLPGGSHLHMFFGNTHVNAFSTYESLLNTGGSTCNGQELNRTGYWVPALFDAEGNVRIPERVVVYYKGEGDSLGESVPYPPEAALIATRNVNTIADTEGGAIGKFSFTCSDQFSGVGVEAANTIPVCDGDRFFDEFGVTDDPHVVLEMNVKFPQCWNGDDPARWDQNFSIPEVGGWYASICEEPFDTNLPNLEYFVNYRVDVGETTEGWYLASDVDPTDFSMLGPGGSTAHGDWWGGWNAEVNQLWIDNCVNFGAETLSGCGFGYLSDGGPDGALPLDGPALNYRPQYTGPHKVPASQLFEELCSPLTDREYDGPTSAAYCLVNEP